MGSPEITGKLSVVPSLFFDNLSQPAYHPHSFFHLGSLYDAVALFRIRFGLSRLLPPLPAPFIDFCRTLVRFFFTRMITRTPVPVRVTFPSHDLFFWTFSTSAYTESFFLSRLHEQPRGFPFLPPPSSFVFCSLLLPRGHAF